LEALRHGLAETKPCEAIVHFGACLPLASLTALRPYLNTNVSATSLLLEMASAWGVKAFVYASSITVVGKPMAVPIGEDSEIKPEHPYSVSKYQAELACEYYRRKGLVAAFSLRLTSPYGAGMSPATVLPAFIRLARESKNIPIYGTGSRTQNFVHVSDVVRATLLAIETPAPGVYNVAGPRSISMLELATMVIGAVSGSTSRVELTGKPDPQEDYRWEIDGTKAERGLGYHASIDLQSGLADYISDLNRNGSARWWKPCA
jgi:UDP-glucose 4-epimerase